MSTLNDTASQLAEQVDGLTQNTAGTLHAAAASIRNTGRDSSRAIDHLAQGTAGRLDRAGAFIESHDLKHAVSGSRHMVRQYPMKSLLAAAGAGFVAGFALRRITHCCAPAGSATAK